MNQLWIHGVKFLLDPVYHGNVGGWGVELEEVGV